MEPITLFARIADPAAVVRRLREIAPAVEVNGPDDDWRVAVVAFTERGGFLRRPKRRTLALTHDPAYYSGPDWVTQLSGMRNYLVRFPDTDRKERALSLPSSFRFALATRFDPDLDPAGDPRLDVLLAVAARLDGVLFTPSSLRDARGRILFGVGGEAEEDPDAAWPRVVAAADLAEPRPGAPDDEANKDEDDDGPAPPTAERVARRALALAAVTTRAILEQEREDAEETHRDLLNWIRDVGLDDEFEPDEWEVLQRPLGHLESNRQVDSSWRLEGLVVLAWALRRFDLPPHDQPAESNPLWKSLGVFDADEAASLLAEPTLRPHEEIAALRKRLFAIHWRLRNHQLRPDVMDFAEFARTCWFGPLDLTGLPLVRGDLGLRGERLDAASEDLFSAAHSAARERHQAANWLCEGPERYSEAEIST